MREISAGQRVICKHKNGRYYQCEVVQLTKETFYEVNFDDGSFSDNLFPEDIVVRGFECGMTLLTFPFINFIKSLAKDPTVPLKISNHKYINIADVLVDTLHSWLSYVVNVLYKWVKLLGYTMKELLKSAIEACVVGVLKYWKIQLTTQLILMCNLFTTIVSLSVSVCHCIPLHTCQPLCIA